MPVKIVITAVTLLRSFAQPSCVDKMRRLARWRGKRRNTSSV